MTNHVHLLPAPHPLYSALDGTASLRLAAYRALLRAEPDADAIDDIRMAPDRGKHWAIRGSSPASGWRQAGGANPGRAEHQEGQRPPRREGRNSLR